VTPTAESRVFETGEEKLLQFAHENKGAFSTSRVTLQSTQAVRTKESELQQKHPGMMEPTALRDRSVAGRQARKAFEYCLQLLKRSMQHLGIPMPRCVAASVRLGHREDRREQEPALNPDLAVSGTETAPRGALHDVWYCI